MDTAQFEWKDFPALVCADDLENYIKYAKTNNDTGNGAQRAYRHEGFYHYTKLYNIEKILSGKSFLLFNPGASNDCSEDSIKDKKRKFMLSFSTGIHENIPMWYLYAGVDGKGGRLSFTKSHIRDIVHCATYSLIEVDGDKKPIDGGVSISLSPSDFKCTLQDIIYYEDSGNAVTLKYNTMTNNGKVSQHEFEKFREKNDAFVKSLAWYYEKETRLLIELSDGALSLLDSDKKYAVKLYFGDLKKVLKSMRLLLAPEVREVSNLLLYTDKYPAIVQFLLNSSNVQCSGLKDQVRMNLCRSCPHTKGKEID